MSRRQNSDLSNITVASGFILPCEHSTLTRFLSDEMRKINLSCEELCQLFNCIQTAAKSISAALSRVGILRMYGPDYTSTGYSYEDLKVIDRLTNEIFISMLRSSYTACLLVSQANQGIIEVEAEKQGKYIICFNALDETNIDSHSSVGSTFAIFKRTSDASPTVKDALQPGRNVVAAGYILYGSATVMVISFGCGVHGFTLNPSVGEFVLTDPDIHIQPRGETYSVNEGYMYQWSPAVAEYVESKKSYKIGKPYNSRYIGSMTGDVHRTLKDGGIVLHPATKKHPKGELCLLYECIPMAYILTQAGGLASDGNMAILDIVPESLHQKSQMFLGSRDDVRDILSIIKKHGKENE